MSKLKRVVEEIDELIRAYLEDQPSLNKPLVLSSEIEHRKQMLLEALGDYVE